MPLGTIERKRPVARRFFSHVERIRNDEGLGGSNPCTRKASTTMRPLKFSAAASGNARSPIGQFDFAAARPSSDNHKRSLDQGMQISDCRRERSVTVRPGMIRTRQSDRV